MKYIVFILMLNKNNKLILFRKNFLSIILYFNVYGFSGAIYEGYFKNGQFHGDGTIIYPKGQQIDGMWNEGRLKKCTFRFPDGLVFTKKWKYCELPDRR